jgi:hypothetical protein
MTFGKVPNLFQNPCLKSNNAEFDIDFKNKTYPSEQMAPMKNFKKNM